MENVDHGLLEHWLLNIRNVQRLHLDELKVCAGIAPADKGTGGLISCCQIFDTGGGGRERREGCVDLAAGLMNLLKCTRYLTLLSNLNPDPIIPDRLGIFLEFSWKHSVVRSYCSVNYNSNYFVEAGSSNDTLLFAAQQRRRP